MTRKESPILRTIAELYEYIEKEALRRIKQMEYQGLIPRRDMDE